MKFIFAALVLLNGLVALPAAETISPSTEKKSAPTFVVNGHTLHAKEQAWVGFVAKAVIPQLKGTRPDRIKIAAEVSWWGLKEGLYKTPNPIAFSSCSKLQPDGKKKDVPLGPLAACETGRAWQVGIAAVQVGNFPAEKVSDTIKELWPEKSIAEILKEAARIAGYKANDPTSTAIANSTGVLQKSWLLRHPVVGFTLVDKNIRNQCINSSHDYCFGSRWPETAAYAPTQQAALKSIADLEKIYDALAP
ncbi:MAG: hypothetical protein JWM68_1535 [Verrucomicrobiales bacterium]|nr:hypothetical protein [Verrucomicrobiales bacterium]